MAGFVQIIEFKSSRIKEIEELGRPSRTEGSTAPTFRRIIATADRDHPGDLFHHRRVRFLRLGNGEFLAGRKCRSSLPRWRNCATDP